MKKTVVITGAASGLGRALSKNLVSLGATVVLLDLNWDELKAFKEELVSEPGKVEISLLDVSSYSATQEVFREVFHLFPDASGLVNCAGITRDGMFHKLSESQFDDVIDVNLKGVHNCAQAFVKNIISRRESAEIVNISSVAYLGNIGQSNYAASKAGVVALTRSLALELSRKGIRVNAVAPGLMDTKMIETIPEKIKAAMIDRIPLKRLGTTEEFSHMVQFLLSDESSYLTGQIIHLDGGLTLGVL